MQTHNRDIKKSSGHEATQFYIWTIWSMNRTSTQPQVNLSLLRCNSLKFQPLDSRCVRFHHKQLDGMAAIEFLIFLKGHFSVYLWTLLTSRKCRSLQIYQIGAHECSFPGHHHKKRVLDTRRCTLVTNMPNRIFQTQVESHPIGGKLWR
jgi:hypothetical protein